MKTKRSIVYFAFAIIIAISLMGCGNTGTEESVNTVASSSIVTSANTPDSKEPVKITLGALNLYSSVEDKDWPYDTVVELKKRTGIEVEFVGYNDDKLKLLLAGGDLPDMLLVNQPYIKQLIEGDMIIPMDEFLDNIGKNIADSSPKRIEFMRKFCSNNTGKVYFISPQAGSAGYGSTIWHGYNIRWDYYKEMGYPEVKNDDDYLNLMSEMQKLHPKTAQGKPVYGMGIFNDWGLWGWRIRAEATFGYYGWGPDMLEMTVDTAELINNYTNFSSPMWMDLKFYNKAYKMGLLDPDSFTMKNADYSAKAGAGQYLSGAADWWLSVGEDGKKPESMAKYLTIPVEGTYAWANMNTQVGQTNKLMCITKNCPKPERAVELLDFLYSPDGLRLMYSGIEGKHWDYVDGKPVVRPETIELGKDPEAWAKTGIGGGKLAMTNYFGLSQWEKHPDGSLLSLFINEADWIKNSQEDAAFKDYCTKYNVQYPYQAHIKMIEQGKAFDQTKLQTDIANALEVPPDDIKRIDTKLTDIMAKAIPRVVMSKNDEQFASEQQKVLADLQAAGAEESFTWWRNAFAEAKKFVTGN